VIAKGTADVIYGGSVIASLGRGDFFGEMAMLGDGHRVADVLATSPITLYDMFGTNFRQLEMGMPEIADQIRETVEERRKVL
jgi:CRP-like cAMP-binding protein